MMSLALFDYPTIDLIRKARCPVMVIHSREDETIPFEMGLELYDAANEPKEFVELHGGHNDAFLISAETYKNAWQKWLKSLADRQTMSNHPVADKSAEQTRITKIS
ncbi:MAG: alpha/beta hydrolase [Sedimentisphaerales bacterium]